MGLTLGGRFLSALVCAGCAAVLGLAAWVKPAQDGHGTHTQLGLTPCVWAQNYGVPCPTCGMTTAFAHAAHGRPGEGFLAQPMGLVLALATSAAFWLSLHAAATGSQIGRVCGKLLTPRLLWSLVALAAAAWAYKYAVWPRP